jgi:hypothetical protein
VQPQTGSKINAGFPSADFRGGDNPADHPGMSRAPQYDGPTTIEVVQPERTIVRDVDEALPIALAGSALLLVLATRGIRSCAPASCRGPAAATRSTNSTAVDQGARRSAGRDGSFSMKAAVCGASLDAPVAAGLDD